jgi:uncharacterized repeat protein (TIGR04138 family)
VSEVQFAEDVLARIRRREKRYHERGYLFVLAAIEFLQERLPQRRHVSGDELAWACRDLALQQYGLTARTVLGHWGIKTTRDIGEMVYALVEVSLLSTQPGDRVEDFEGVYDFTDALGPDRVWARVALSPDPERLDH